MNLAKGKLTIMKKTKFVPLDPRPTISDGFPRYYTVDFRNVDRRDKNPYNVHNAITERTG